MEGEEASAQALWCETGRYSIYWIPSIQGGTNDVKLPSNPNDVEIRKDKRSIPGQ